MSHTGRRTPAHQEAVIGLRRGNAAQPHRDRTRYTRKFKHANRKDY